MTVREEWYRGPTWDPAARSDFEQRLHRARAHNRSQYLRIKALALREAGECNEARELLLRLIAEYPQTIDAASATELLGDIAGEQGRAAEAESWYRRVLRQWPTLNGTSAMVEVSLAELLTIRGGDTRCREAHQLLESRLDRGSMFDNELFRWHVAHARAATQLGDTDTAKRSARTALSLVGRGPRFPRHPTVGIVHTNEDTLTWLRRVAAPSE